MKQKNSIWIDTTLLALLVIPSTLFRFLTLNSILFGIDECFHLMFALKPTLRDLFSSLNAVAPQQFPLDYLFNFLAVRVTTDLVQLRIIPLFWGACSIALCYVFGKQLWNRTFGWFWGWLMATSVLHMCYSQLLRPYSLIVFLSLAFLFLTFKTLENKKWLPLFALSAILFQTAYPFALAFGAAAILFSFWIQSKNRAAIAAGVAISWIFPLFWFWKAGPRLFSGQVFTYNTPPHWLADFVTNVMIPFGQGTKGRALAFMVASLSGMGLALKSKNHRKQAAFAMATVILAGILIIGSMWRAHLFLDARHFISLLPIFLAFTAVPLAWSGRNIVVSAAISFCVAMFSFSPIQGYLGQQILASNVLQNGSLFLKTAFQPNDMVIYSNPNFAATFLYYYDRPAFFRSNDITLRNGFNLVRLPPDIFTLCSIDPTLATIDREKFNIKRKETFNKGGRIWLISSSINYIDESPPFPRALDVDVRLMKPVYTDIYLLTENKQ